MVKKGGRADIMTKTNNIAPSANVVKESVILGDVSIGEDSTVLFHAVLRGDDDSISVGKCSNIQDNCTVHADRGYPAVIGDCVTVGHNAVVHGAVIGNDVLIGMGAVVLDNARIPDGTIIAAGAVVLSGSVLEPGIYAGVPAGKVKDGSAALTARIHDNAAGYLEYKSWYEK